MSTRRRQHARVWAFKYPLIGIGTIAIDGLTKIGALMCPHFLNPGLEKLSLGIVLSFLLISTSVTVEASIDVREKIVLP